MPDASSAGESAALPVMQASKFALIVNLQTARVMAFEVPGTLQKSMYECGARR